MGTPSFPQRYFSKFHGIFPLPGIVFTDLRYVHTPELAGQHVSDDGLHPSVAVHGSLTLDLANRGPAECARVCACRNIKYACVSACA
jgi:hypothetical protein